MGLAYGSPFVAPLAWLPGPTFSSAIDSECAKRRGPPTDLLWRVEAVSYATSDEWGDYRSTGPRLELFAFLVDKWTPCGARVRGRWVDLRDGHKQWASRTPAQALEQFKARRRAQVWILEKQLSRAMTELNLAKGATDGD